VQDFYVFIPLFGIVSGTIITVTGMALISRHILHRKQQRGALPTEEVLRRLERIEQIVDTTAIEVERLAESNRFVAKLLAQRSEVPASTTRDGA
jgi:hypothetical protein